MNKLNQNTNLLKLIAIISMLIDHIGAVFFPNTTILRCIGRLAFPLFFYCTFIGYFKTKNLKKYIIRLFILAVISEPIYILLFNRYELNVCFCLIFELLFLYLLDNKKYLEYIILLTISILFIPITSYLLMSIFLVPIFYYTKNTKWLFSISYILFYILLTYAGYGFVYLFSIFSLLLIILNDNKNIKINNKLFYYFYPINILILYLIKLLF